MTNLKDIIQKKKMDKFKQHRPLENNSKWAIMISASDPKTNNLILYGKKKRLNHK